MAIRIKRLMGIITGAALLLAMGVGYVHDGYAARYNPGVMKMVAENRGLSIESCMISSPLYNIGEWVYVYGEVTNVRLYCRVTDTSAPQDRKRHIRTRLYAELNYDAARIICGSVTNSNKECPIKITHA